MDERIPLLIDTDPGVDDALALLIRVKWKFVKRRALLTYPDAQLREVLPQLVEVLETEQVLRPRLQGG